MLTDCMLCAYSQVANMQADLLISMSVDLSRYVYARMTGKLFVHNMQAVKGLLASCLNIACKLHKRDMQHTLGVKVCVTCSGRGHKAGPRANRAGPLRLPEWQLVPGTRFVVDKFGTKAAEAAPQTKHSFLTHFHADHYGGLGPRFKQGTSLLACICATNDSTAHTA